MSQRPSSLPFHPHCLQVPDPGLQGVRDKIRFGLEPDNPTLFALWLMQEERALSAVACRQQRRCHLETQFRLLLDAAMDELVPRHWRCQCLDQIYKPLGSLQKIVDSPASEHQLKQLLWEFSVSSRFVQHSLN